MLRERHARHVADSTPLACCICLENITIVSVTTFCRLVQCSRCDNIFHGECFRKHINASMHPSCPLCKKDVDDDDLNTGWEIRSGVVDTFYDSDEESYVLSEDVDVSGARASHATRRLRG